MIQLRSDVDLRPFNTFRISARACHYCQINSVDEFRELIQHPIYRNNRVMILGGGSNVLFTHDFDGLVVHDQLKGISADVVSNEYVNVTAAAGEVWHDLVMYAVKHQWGGIENLALIPGTVGAAPIQNIGAYGIEIKECLKSVEAIDRMTGEIRQFSSAECKFGYRDSVFKGELKEKFFISSVTLTLTHQHHRINTSYGAIKDTLKSMNIIDATITDVANAVIDIRRSKLPDPSVIGNAGSFFKNPTISLGEYESIKLSYPLIPGYPGDNQQVKVPAGWLIEQCGWKGKRVGDIGVHQHQALVLVNYNNGSGSELIELAHNIQSSVKQKFSIDITPEVNIIS